MVKRKTNRRAWDQTQAIEQFEKYKENPASGGKIIDIKENFVGSTALYRTGWDRIFGSKDTSNNPDTFADNEKLSEEALKTDDTE
jgi:hypothetical protein